jgi:hypothetical protein
MCAEMIDNPGIIDDVDYLLELKERDANRRQEIQALQQALAEQAAAK